MLTWVKTKCTPNYLCRVERKALSDSLQNLSLHGYSKGRSKGKTWSDLAHLSPNFIFHPSKKKFTEYKSDYSLTFFPIACFFFASFPKFLFQSFILNAKYFGLCLDCPIFQ